MKSPEEEYFVAGATQPGTICKIKLPEDISEFTPIANQNGPQSQTNKLLKSAIWTQIGVTSCVATMHLAAGCAFGYTGIILPSVTDPNSKDIYMTTEQVAIYASILMVGNLIGSLISAPIAVRYGQRISLLMITPLALIGWVIPYFSYDFWLQVLSRIIVGIFASAACGISVTYVAETVHSSLRGRLIAITDLARQLGFFLVFVVGSTKLNWRTVGLVCGLTPLVLPCLVLPFLPNSPRWLAVKNKRDELIKASLQFFNGSKYDVGSDFHEIQIDVKKAKKSSTTWQQFKLLNEKSIFKRVILLIYLNIAAIFTGNAVIVTYSVTIFQSAQTGFSAYTSTIICGAIRILGSFLYIALADRLGRRFLSIVFLTLGGLSTTNLGVYFYLKEIRYDTSNISWLPLVSLILFTLFTCLAHPVIRLLRSELLPNSFRNVGVNLLYFFFFLGSFVATVIYPFMAEGIGIHWTFWIYSLNSFLMSVVIFVFLPETKGKTLEEIEKMF